MLLVSLIVSAALAAWGKYWGGLFAGMEALLHAANFVLSLLVISVLFALMYSAQIFLFGAEFIKAYAGGPDAVRTSPSPPF